MSEANIGTKQRYLRQHRFTPDVDVALLQQVFDFEEIQREPKVTHRHQANEYRAALNPIERVTLFHFQTQRGRPARLNRSLSDITRCCFL